MAVSLPPFQALLDEHRVDVYRFVVALVGPQEAEDCFQETFVAALRGYPALTTISTRRFLDLPWFESLPATGRYSPQPATTHCPSGMPVSSTR